MTQNMPLISIIVPVYKVENYLDRCVESIVNQTYKRLEIILVDDGSPDNSPAICDSWSERDPRIKVIHKRNGGAAEARNAGLDVASGEYIGFVDSDDYIDKDMYRCMLAELEKSCADIACCKSLTVSNDDENACVPRGTYDVKFLNSKETVEAIFAFRIGTSFWRRLFHKNLFDDIRFPIGEINEEYPLLVPLAAKSSGTVLIEKVFYYYRDRSDSVTGTLHKSLSTLRCVKKNLELMRSQLSKYKLDDVKNFSFFVAKNSFNMLLSILKNYRTLEGETLELYKSYYNMAKENKWAFFRSKQTSLKDKLLLVLLLTGLYKKIIDIRK
ncbi:MAG: glycosyltransferase [Ruminococcaceae bacterium]|nr:glycosyltransferase [Oscillospiraceae bacterium]